MKRIGILLIGSLAAAACASNNPPPAASSATIEHATTEPNRGPDFAPAASDGLATSPAEGRRSNAATQPAPNLNPPAEATPARTTSNDGTWGAGAGPATGNAAAAPAERSAQPATDRAAQPATGADNSRVNQRDKGGETLTPMDQGGSEADRKMTQQIRQEVMKDKSLSFTAKNVKIITVNGKVTLRGPVKSEAERTAVEAAARRVAGSGAVVDSQLELTK